MADAGMEVERQRVDAKAAARYRGAVVKDVPKMRMAVGAGHLGAVHAVAVIGHHFYAAGQSGVKTGPTAAAVKFLFRGKQRIAATGANKNPFFVKLVIFAGESGLSPFVMQNIILLSRERAVCLHKYLPFIYSYGGINILLFLGFLNNSLVIATTTLG